MSLPLGIKIAIAVFLVTVVLAPYEYEAFTTAKKCGYKMTGHQILKLQITVLKSIITDISRAVILFIVVIVPLALSVLSTYLSIEFAINSLFGGFLTSLPIDYKIFLSSVYLFVSITAMHYFLGRYGAVYKLPAVLLFSMRDDVKQLLEKHQNLNEEIYGEILVVLVFGSVIYLLIISALLGDLVHSSSVLSKIDDGVTIALLLGYVLFNNKYDNAIGLIETIWRG